MRAIFRCILRSPGPALIGAALFVFGYAFYESSQAQETSAAPAAPAVASESRGTTVPKAMAIKVRTAQGQELSDATTQLGFEYVRDNDLGLLMAVNEQGGVGVVQRPAYALSSLAWSDSFVLMRYNVYSGESSMTQGGATAWDPVKERSPPPNGVYQVVITGPYKIDGQEYYNAARIELNTGMCWYYCDREWLPYEDSEIK